MGWVAQKIEDYKITARSITPLWNSLRDSVGDAVIEFGQSFNMPGVDHSDCRARGRLCIRVQKPGHFIEIFLSESDQSIKLAPGIMDISGSNEDGTIREICRYRLKKDRSDLEFWMEGKDGEFAVASADDVAKQALEKFLFDPFPNHLIIRRSTNTY